MPQVRVSLWHGGGPSFVGAAGRRLFAAVCMARLFLCIGRLLAQTLDRRTDWIRYLSLGVRATQG